MGSFSLWHWLVVLALVLLLFGGRGKISKLMRDLGQGVSAFKKGVREDDKPIQDVAARTNETSTETKDKGVD